MNVDTSYALIPINVRRPKYFLSKCQLSGLEKILISSQHDIFGIIQFYQVKRQKIQRKI